VLADYPREIVEFAADPRTGVITKFPMGLPNVGQISGFLADLLTQKARLERYAALPKLQPYRPEPVKLGPNLFVPASVRRYDEMAARAHAEPDKARFDDERNGVHVPLSWWEGEPDNANALQMATRAAAFFDTHAKADGVTIGDVPVSKELAGKLGVGNGYAADTDIAAA
jgi:hypothetical protein